MSCFTSGVCTVCVCLQSSPTWKHMIQLSRRAFRITHGWQWRSAARGGNVWVPIACEPIISVVGVWMCQGFHA